MKNKQKTSAFTLIEAIIVITVISVLASIAVPKMFTTKSEADEAKIRKILFDTRQKIMEYKATNDAMPTDAVFLVDNLFLGTFSDNPFVNSIGICDAANGVIVGEGCWYEEGIDCNYAAGCTMLANNHYVDPSNPTVYGWVYSLTTPPYFWATDGAHDSL